MTIGFQLGLQLMFICAETKIVNYTDLPWNSHDQKHLEIAQKRCGELYKNSKCLKEFRKRTSSDYSAICGKEQK